VDSVISGCGKEKTVCNGVEDTLDIPVGVKSGVAFVWPVKEDLESPFLVLFGAIRDLSSSTSNFHCALN
jgi:hypothetical protein